MIKDAVRDMLWQQADSYLSGAELGRRLSVSRTAVWKAIEQLKAEGYRIESVPNRGYRLSSDSDVLSEEGIRRWLSEPRLQLRVYPRISSTNTVLKGLAAEGAPEGLALVAGEQTAGRGRMGRGFFSPPDSGVYMSLLLRPRLPAAEAVAITACAAVAAAETMPRLFRSRLFRNRLFRRGFFNRRLLIDSGAVRLFFEILLDVREVAVALILRLLKFIFDFGIGFRCDRNRGQNRPDYQHDPGEKSQKQGRPKAVFRVSRVLLRRRPVAPVARAPGVNRENDPHHARGQAAAERRKDVLY